MSLDLSKLSDDQLRQLYAEQQSVHQIESGGASDTRADIVNPASGARGSMQVMTKTARDPGFGVTPSNGTPEDDARMGRDYYAALSMKYNDPLHAAVAYNWGPRNADKWIANGSQLSQLPDETLKYIRDHGVNIAKAAPQQQALAAPAQPAQNLPPQPTVSEMNIVQEPRVDTPEYTRMGRVEQGVMQGLGGMGRAGMAGLEWLLGKVGDTQGASNARDVRLAAEDAASKQANEFALKAQEAGANPNATDWYQVGGKMIPSFLIPAGAPSSVVGAALTGAAGGAISGAADTPPGESYLKHAGAGAAFGGAGGAAMHALARVIGGANLSPEAQLLKDEGATLTPGMVGGHVLNDLEQKAMSVPVVGPLIGDARRAAVQDLNDAAYARALNPIGGSIERGTPVREALGQIKDQLQGAYRQVLPHLSFAPDAQYTQDMQQVLTRQAQLPDDLRRSFDTVMDDAFRKATVPGPNGTQVLTGDALKKAESILSDRAKNFSSTRDAFQRDLGNIYRDALTALRSALMRQNPQYAQRLQDINNGYGIYSILRQGAQNVKNPDNPIMPGQLANAVRNKDASVAKDAFARGAARMQDLSDAGMAVLGATVPDSGTAGRVMMGAGLGLGIPALLAHPGMMAGAAGAAAGYGTDAGQKAMFALLARRPDLARQLSEMLQNQAGRAGILSGSLFSQQSNQ